MSETPDIAGRVPIPAAVEEGKTYWWCARSEEHTSELQSRSDLVCRLLLEKKKKKKKKKKRTNDLSMRSSKDVR